MSSTIIAHTIIGSKVNRDDFFVHKERSVHEGCGVVGPGPFCSNCGKAIDATKIDIVPVEGFEEEGGSEYKGLIGGLSIHPINNDHYLAVHVSRCGAPWRDDIGDPSRMDADELIDKLPGMRDKVQSVLEPLGLWEPENFGIWTALYYGA